MTGNMTRVFVEGEGFMIRGRGLYNTKVYTVHAQTYRVELPT